ANLTVLREAVLELGARGAQDSLCNVAMVRIVAGFPSAPLLAGLEARGIDYVARLKANCALDRLAAPYMKWACDLQMDRFFLVMSHDHEQLKGDVWPATESAECPNTGLSGKAHEAAHDRPSAPL
ncbi:MAG: hypothetical protein EA386_12760, partial [Rhodobacteraceae bacterium]